MAMILPKEKDHNLTAGKTIELEKARDGVRKMLSRIRAAHESGQHEKAGDLGCEYLKSPDARYLAVLTADKNMRSDRRSDPDLLPVFPGPRTSRLR